VAVNHSHMNALCRPKGEQNPSVRGRLFDEPVS
jgi:hypothetical protein